MTTAIVTVDPVEAALERAVATSEERPVWLAARRGGVTATEAGALRRRGAAARATLVRGKLAGKDDPLLRSRYVERGHAREPFLAEWASARFGAGFVQNRFLLHAVGNRRHLATPDMLGALGGRLVTGEIKTSKYDLTPGEVDADGYLIAIDPKSKYAKTDFYDQKQWAMYVAGPDVEEALFVYEQHDDNWPNPQPIDLEPGWCWVPRDEARIDQLVEAADAALEELDRWASGDGPKVEYDPTLESLAVEVLFARDLEKGPKADKDRAWKALLALLQEKGQPLQQRGELAQVTYTPGGIDSGEVVDEDRARAANPDLWATLQAAREAWDEHAARFKKMTTRSTGERLTVTAVMTKEGDD